MAKAVSSDVPGLALGQGRVLAGLQARGLGLDKHTVRNRVRYGDWQRLHRGVYATYTGEPDREARLWAAILRAGENAALSHFTAAERHGMLKNPSHLIHVMVPAIRNPERCGKIPGVVIHRSNAVFNTRHPAMTPPCIRIADTVLDLISVSRTPDAKFDWVCRAVGGRLTTPERLLEALTARKRFAGRRDVELMLGHADEGILSWLEREWMTGVEQPHGLPAARRQARVRQYTGNKYLDNFYAGYQVCVELDGRAAHPESEQRKDNARDRWNLVHENIVTMRFRVPDLTNQRGKCAAAADLAAVLNGRRTAGTQEEVGRPCGPECPVGRPE
jgi:very-short-patch-repair endonuclease